MSLSTPPSDDSESNLDRFGDNSLIRPQYTYHPGRILESLLAHSRAAYDSVQLPSSGIGNDLYIVGLYPFETTNPTSFPTGSPQYLKKGENPSALRAGSKKEAYATNTAEASCPPTQDNSANMLNNGTNTTITGGNFQNNSRTNNWSISIQVSLSFLFFFAFFCVYVFFADSMSGDISVLLPRSPIPPTSEADVMHGFERLESFVSLKAINASQYQDPNCRVHPGTRDNVLIQIKAWIDNPNATERILWLQGPAGVGKSAIAHSITHSYTTVKVPANFFFFRSDPDRSNGNLLFTTLAWQLASSIPAIKGHIVRSLVEQPYLPTRDVETQFQELIVRPFEALSNHARQHQLSDLVVVIDGVDECADTDLQKRFLKVIGDVVTNNHFPLRFLIFCRSEAHIQETINRFQPHTLSIDLTKDRNANDDIGKYLKDKFADIANGQRIDPAKWPSQEMIQQLIHRASGQFMYAATVIKFVGDKNNDARTQLDIIRGLKPRTTTQPFAELDILYMAILEWQPDQEFLKTFLALFAARKYWKFTLYSKNDPEFPDYIADSSSCPSDSCYEFYLPEFPSFPSRFHDRGYGPHLDRSQTLSHDSDSGYAVLMNVSEAELRIKLLQMTSVLEITPDAIRYHHLSFLEFLRDPSRSGQYGITKANATRQYLMANIQSLVRSAKLVIEQHNDYSVPQFVNNYSISFDIVSSSEDCLEALRPLQDFQDELLILPNFTMLRINFTIFDILHCHLSHLSYHRRFLDKPEENDGAVIQSVLMQSPREVLSSLLTYLRRLKGMFDLMYALHHDNPEVIATRVCSWSEAQILMDLIDHIVNGKHLLTNLFSADVAQKAIQLAFEIHTRVPVLPQFFLSTSTTTYEIGPYSDLWSCWSCNLEFLCRVLIISNFLDHRYILPVLRTEVVSDDGWSVKTTLISDDIGMPIYHWRKSTEPSSNAIIFVMLELARTIQYLHSMGVLFLNDMKLDSIYVDSKSRVRISPVELGWSIHDHSLPDAGPRYKSNIIKFAYFFCKMYLDINAKSFCVVPTANKFDSSVHGDVLRLIQRCSSDEGHSNHR